MKRIFPAILALLFFKANGVKAQSTDSLHRLPSISFPAFYSNGQETRARYIAILIGNALAYHQKRLEYKPDIRLMVLDTADWRIYSSKGAVYGMPHYDNERKTLIVAAQDNPFWKSFLPSADKLPADLRTPIIATYSNKDGSLSARAFFDLLAIHELGHSFHIQAAVKMQRNWMSELFCNIFLHTYIAGKEPALLPALTLFPKLVVAGGSKGFKYTSLKDLQDNYNDVATRYPRNYGWYQCRWHVAAGNIYDADGKKAYIRLWNNFKKQPGRIEDDATLSAFLESSGNAAAAAMMQQWDNDTIR
jgi:hypothetical protein